MSSNPSDFIVVMTTVGSETAAQRIADELVTARLAACVQVEGPIRSTYRWQNVVETASEWRCMIKTRADLYHQAEQLIQARHPYEIPEIIALPVTHGLPGYLTWMKAATSR